MMTGDIERLLAVNRLSTAGSGDDVIRVIGLGLAGRRDEARRAIVALRQATRLPVFRSYTDTLAAWLDRRPADMYGVAELEGLKIMDDPEAIFQEGWLFCDVGEHERGLAQVRRAVAKGYCVAPTLSGSRSFDAVRRDPAFQELLAEAEADGSGPHGLPRRRRRAPARPASVKTLPRADKEEVLRGWRHRREPALLGLHVRAADGLPFSDSFLAVTAEGRAWRRTCCSARS
jgi:hypothetical protein